jgi:hypothetical protein
MNPQLLYQFAVPHCENQWLIVPTLMGDRYGFWVFDPDGQDWSGDCHPWTYPTPEMAIQAGRCYVDLAIAEMAQEAA